MTTPPTPSEPKDPIDEEKYKTLLNFSCGLANAVAGVMSTLSQENTHRRKIFKIAVVDDVRDVALSEEVKDTLIGIVRERFATLVKYDHLLREFLKKEHPEIVGGEFTAEMKKRKH